MSELVHGWKLKPALAKEKLSKLLRNQFQDRSFCDAELKLKDGTSIKTHRCVLAAYSKAFREMLDPTSESSQAKSGIIHLPDDPPVAIRVLLDYLYSSSTMAQNYMSAKEPMYFCVKDYLNQNGGVFSESPEAYSPFWICVVEIYLVAEKYVVDSAVVRARRSLTACMPDRISIGSLLNIGFKIYDSTSDKDHPLRKLIVWHIQERLRKHIDKLEKSDFKNDAMKHPEFLCDIALREGHPHIDDVEPTSKRIRLE